MGIYILLKWICLCDLVSVIFCRLGQKLLGRGDGGPISQPSIIASDTPYVSAVDFR